MSYKTRQEGGDSKVTNIEFGKMVRLKRLEQGLSQDKLAKLTNMSNATINAVENAKHEAQPKTKLALAVALGVDPKEWL